jgi:hypothetical protein
METCALTGMARVDIGNFNALDPTPVARPPCPINIGIKAHRERLGRN